MNNYNNKPAIFLDRDGVLTKEKSYVCSKDELEIFSYARECICALKNMGYWTIVITNQSGIARGFFSESELQDMNLYLKEQIEVDDIYYCPHHPDGIVLKYKGVCQCRKPQTGLLERARRKYGIDLSNSYMVGDRASDIVMGENMGIKTVLLESGYGTGRLEQEIKPDFVLKDLDEFVKILKEERGKI